ncbi:MAG: phosphodiester glycosidase family protein, partial [Myxococcota bacterium]
ALEILDQVREQEGLIVTSNRHAAMMTDIVNVDRFHMGWVGSPLEAEIMGIPQDSGYVQWVPAGLRFCLAYPTPVQTAADFSRVLRSERYRELCRRRGETEVLAHLRRDAEEKGTPIEAVLQQMDSQSDHSGAVVHSSINGIYDDGHPWAGVIATVDTSAHRMQFRIVTSDGRPKTVPQIVEDLNRSSDHQVRIAWNGGYILNAELVGKLGIPESYIGSPLGVIISDGRVVCPPLFNKPAFLVYPDGRLAIKRVSCAHGITLSTTDRKVVMGATQRNPDAPGSDPAFYDLLYPHPVVPGDGRVVCRLAGNRIMEIHRTLAGQDLPVVPVGLTLSFPPQQFPGWQVGQELEIQLNGWPPLAHAIEAGPLLLGDGRVCIDMVIEGWKTENSIRTQAARLDYTDMRGPKIAIGLDASGGITVVAVNGRIRESVGATHLDMARILESRGMVTAMGFDPGGSSTLVVDGRALNVSPYNHRYESNIYSLPPEPRVVANAVIGY